MLLGHRPESQLDLLHPDIKSQVEKKQEKQKERHDHHARERQLKPDDNVYVRSFSSNNTQQWLPGVWDKVAQSHMLLSWLMDVLQASGPCLPVSHSRVRNGQLHRVSPAESDHCGNMFTSDNASERTTRRDVGSPCWGGTSSQGHTTPTHTPNMRVASPKPLSLVVPSELPEVLGRSQRTRKPPDRLNIWWTVVVSLKVKTAILFTCCIGQLWLWCCFVVWC